MFRKILAKPLTWLIASTAVIIAVAMSLGYLGAFLGPESSVHDFPLGIVNEDAGITVLGQPRNTGEDVMSTILADDSPSTGKVKWHVFESRDELVNALEANEIYAGIVIPANFTQNLAGVMQPALAGNNPQQAEVEVVYNHGGGSIAAANARNITAGVTGRIQAIAQQQVQASIQSDTIPADMLNVYASPVRIVETDLVPAVAHTGSGMAPIYVAIVATVGGLLAASILNMGVDFMAGHTSLGPRLERMRGEPLPASLTEMYLLKSLLLVVASLVGGLATTLIATRLLDLPVSSEWLFFGLVVIGMLAAGGPTLAFIALIGTPGILLGLLLTTILGVPSSGGVFPHALMPKVYTWLGTVAPVRYFYDAVRSVVFFDGRAEAGLSTWWVLVLYAAGGLIVGYVATVLVQRHRRRVGESTPPAPDAPPVSS